MYANNGLSGLGDIDALLSRAIISSSTGEDRLSDEELAMVAQSLAQGGRSVEKGMLLRILALSGDVSYRQTLESFLSGPDPGLAKSALWYLCNYWDLTYEYEGTIHEYLMGVPWDFTGNGIGMCRPTAFFVIDGYLESSDTQLLEDLVSLAEASSTDEVTRHFAINALRKVVGDPESDVVERARRLLPER